MTYDEIIKKLKSLGSEKNILGMERFGINIDNALGINIPVLRNFAKEIKKEYKSPQLIHQLALKLWDSGYHEARYVSGFIDRPELVTEIQMEDWILDFNSWDICDSICGNLFDKTDLAIKKIYDWQKRPEEFVKRSAFSLIAYLAVHNKNLTNEDFLRFFPLILESSTDNRIYVKKGVNWALRQIGKRNLFLNKKAISVSLEIKKISSPSAQWIVTDALRELKSEPVIKRLRKK